MHETRRVIIKSLQPHNSNNATPLDKPEKQFSVPLRFSIEMVFRLTSLGSQWFANGAVCMRQLFDSDLFFRIGFFLYAYIEIYGP